jgi:hypothetical protein
MTSPLPTVAHEHHERLLHRIDTLPALGDRVGTAPAAELVPEVDSLVDFLKGTLLPHIDAAERTLYPELERLFQNQHSMTPMRREHDEVRRRIAELADLRGFLDGHAPTMRSTVALRRSVFGLYALLKVHLAEEDLYLAMVQRGVTEEASAVLAAAMDHPMVAAS